MLSNHSYANGVEKWLDLSLQVATNLWLPVYSLDALRHPPGRPRPRHVSSCSAPLLLRR